MKMTKKFFAAALAVAALSLVGCNMNEDEYGILDFDEPNDRCTTDYTNETTEYLRGWATFNTNHITSNCIIEMSGLDSVTSENEQKGNMGVVFNLVKNDDKTYNFNVITLKYGGNEELWYYISYYTNVDASYLSGSVQNFCDLDGKEANTPGGACKEVQIAPTAGNGTWIKGIKWTVTDNKLSAYIKLDYSETDGYTISVYDGTDDSTSVKFSKDKITNGLEKELDKVRAGKANVKMLDTVKVDYYGTPTPLAQVASLSTPDPKQIVIHPWEKSMISPIEKAILAANLGFNPQNNGEVVRVVVPALTEERRKELVKKVKQESEQAKISIRNIRRKANDEVKKLKDDGVPEDEAKKAETSIQKTTDDFIAKVDQFYGFKEKEIMTI